MNRQLLWFFCNSRNHVFKSKYYDFSIYHVSEITRNEKIVYTIHLEDNKWKTVRVIDGEMELIQHLDKK